MFILLSSQYLEQDASSSFSSLPVTKAGQAGDPVRWAHTLPDGCFENIEELEHDDEGNFPKNNQPHFLTESQVTHSLP